MILVMKHKGVWREYGVKKNRQFFQSKSVHIATTDHKGLCKHISQPELWIEEQAEFKQVTCPKCLEKSGQFNDLAGYQQAAAIARHIEEARAEIGISCDEELSRTKPDEVKPWSGAGIIQETMNVLNDLHRALDKFGIERFEAKGGK